ncbi:hypothetical protein [Sphingomonas zeae]|jgi:hypothetical protein
MTAAYRLKGIGWFGSCVAVVLGFYLVSLQVAAERKKLDDVNGRIAAAQRDIRALETEFDTRANLVQLEKWNGDTLALTAPVAGQFVGDETQLASLDVTHGPTEGAIQTAALLVPSQPAPVIVQPEATTPAASPKPNAPAPVVRLAKVDLPKPQIVQAVSEHVVTPRKAKPAPLATVRTAAAVAKVRPEAVAMLDRQLLSDTTLGDILKGAKTESRRRR